MGEGTLLVAFRHKWVPGEEALLFGGRWGAGCFVPQLRFKCMELRTSRSTG